MVRWENDQVPVPKSAVMVLFLANVINDSGDSSLQMMTWPERERNRWRHFLSTKNHPVDMMAFAELRWLLDLPDPVVPTKEEMERLNGRHDTNRRRKAWRWLQMMKLIVYICASWEFAGPIEDKRFGRCISFRILLHFTSKWVKKVVLKGRMIRYRHIGLSLLWFANVFAN